MGKVITYEANTSRVVIAGVELALLDDISFEDDYAPEGTSGIGDIHTQEYYPTQARHRCSLSGSVRRDNTTVSLEIYLENGDAALNRKTFQIEVFDKRAGTLLRKMEDAQFASGSMRLAKHRVFLSNAQFVGIDMTGAMTSGGVLGTPAPLAA